jgi:SAM-dependent methyltransferase
MEKKEYEVMFNIEDEYWWYIGLRDLVLSYINTLINNKDSLTVLDAGCGTGKTLEDCKVYNKFGLDFSEEALAFCKKRKLQNLVRGSISAVPFKKNTFDITISLDVLYHAAVDNDISALEELYHAIKQDGVLILNLPAYNFLQSQHDKAVHTRQRYTVKELSEKVKKAGFRIEKITYRNTVLFPLMFIKRIIDKIFIPMSEQTESDLKQMSRFLNKFLTMILFTENVLINLGISLPFGLSVYCIARKQ